MIDQDEPLSPGDAAHARRAMQGLASRAADARRERRSARRWYATSAVIAVATVAIIVGPFARDDAGPAGALAMTRSGPTLAMHGSQDIRFDSVAEMVATADAVVEAEVVSVKRGHVSNEDSEPVSVQISRHATLNVLEVFHGSPPATITFAELGWNGRGERLVLDEWPGVETGDRVLLFLRKYNFKGQTQYSAVTSATQFLLPNTPNAVLSGHPSGDHARETLGVTPSQLRDAVRGGAFLAKTGKAKRRQPFDWAPATEPPAPHPTGTFTAKHSHP
jgi:hypothetical protein